MFFIIDATYHLMRAGAQQHWRAMRHESCAAMRVSQRDGAIDRRTFMRRHADIICFVAAADIDFIFAAGCAFAAAYAIDYAAF